MRESCFGSGTQGKQDCYEYHQGRTEVNMRQKNAMVSGDTFLLHRR